MDKYEIPNHPVVHQPSSMDLTSADKGLGGPPMNGHTPVEFSRTLEDKRIGSEDVKDCIVNGLLNVLGCFVTVFQAIGSCFCSFCDYGEPPSTEPGSEILPTWRMLWVEFVNRTTWHGLKYLELRSRYLARKMIWTAVMLSNITLFMYIMTTKLQNLLTYPVSVSVTVSYGEKPPFSAATICNHNPYRMTAMHENGLYDIMVSDLDPSCTFCDDFLFYPGICNVKYGGTSFHLRVSNVTRKVCMFMCANAYDAKCSGFLYDRRTKSCNLTSYTGEWIDPSDPPCESSRGLEFYRRIRKTPQTEIICTFEDSLCPLNPSNNENDAFVLLEARLDGVLKDNTLSLGSGHVMSLRTTELKSGYTAQMTLPFLNTTDSCMEFFYWLKLEDPDSGDLPSISVSVMTEELERKTLTSTNRYIKDWNRLFTRLPDGLHQIIIEGTRSLNQSSGISIDDLTIEKCQNFEKSRDCKRTRLGTAYLGTTNVSAKGEKCIPWDQLKSPVIYRLPDDNPRDAKNYCRNIPQENWSEPSCMVSSDENYYVSACNVSYCACFNDTYFKCDNGLCLPPSLLCNGVKDCLDGSDEAEICRNRQNVECVFNDDYVCGYTMESVGQLTWTRVPSSELTSYTDVTIYRNVIALSHLMFLDSKMGQNGDIAQLISPLWNFKNWTTINFSFIMIGSGLTESETSSLALYQLSALKSPVKLLTRLTPSQSKDFRQGSVCAPPGQYHLMFQGVQGMPYEQIMGLPYVELGGPCVFDNNTSVSDATEISSMESLEGPTSFNCSFTSLCGYKFLSTTRYLNWNLIYAKNALKTDDPSTPCGNSFKGVQGFIYSPEYPKDYPANMDCEFYIDEPEGTTITIVFHDFSIESQSDCLFDRLEITDPYLNITKVYCGDLLPPKFMSKGNKLILKFKSDASQNSGRFKMQYFTYADKATEYAIAFKYLSPSALNRFVHKAALISPPMTISTNRCLVVTMIAVTPFKIKLSYLDNVSKYHEKVILSSSTSLGWTWHKQWLDLTLLNTEFLVRYEFQVGDSMIKEPALIGDIKNMGGPCRNLPELQSSTLECNFGNVTQCGYIDHSEGPIHWFRVYNLMANGFYMMSSFPPGQSKQTTTLQSADVPSSSEAQCLEINYFTNFKTFTLTVSSTNPADVPPVSKKLQTDGEFQVYYPLRPSVGKRSIVIVATYVSGNNKDDATEREVRIRRIEVLKGSCPSTADESTKLDCTFDNFLACNYKLMSPFGGSWSWTSWPQLVADAKDNRLGVLYYSQTRRSTLKGVVSTPIISGNGTSSLSFQAYSSDIHLTNLSVLVGDSLGLPATQTSLLDVEWVKDSTWHNFTICIPPGDWHLFFVADVLHASEAVNSSGKPFVAIDNIVWTPNASLTCIPKMEAFIALKCNKVDLTDCPSSLISWSRAMTWLKVNNAPSGFSQTKEGCLYVFDQSEGWFKYSDTGKQYKNSSECDVYIRGKGRMEVELWLDEMEIQNCSLQYVQVWYRNESGDSSSDFICTKTGAKPRTYVTDKIIQVHISSYNGFPKLKFRYKYSTLSSEGYMFGLYYDGVTKYQGNSTDSVAYTVASWLSPEIHVEAPIDPLVGADVCFKIDLLLSHVSLAVFSLSQLSPSAVNIVPVFAASSKTRDQGWINATFQAKLGLSDGLIDLSSYSSVKQKHQFLFAFTIDSKKTLNDSLTTGGTLLAALDNLRIDLGPCERKSPTTSKLYCKPGDRNSCHFVDISLGPSRWISSTYLSKTANNNEECQLSDNGYVYTGNVSTTIFGRTCQRWESQVPHKHNQDLAEYFPDLSMNSTGNKCRNPSNPFIPRNCWCYTMELTQRREFCDIQPCVESFFQAELDSSNMNPAMFVTEVDVNVTSCLLFSYDTTTTLVHLEIITRETPYGPDNLKAILRREQASASINWVKSSITLTVQDKYIIFLARMTDYTSKNPYAYLSNITIAEGACIKEQVEPTYVSTRVPYTGRKLPRTAYREVLLNEIANETMEVLNWKMAHQQSDLIHKCRFDGVDCSEGTIISQMTDMGQCYTFNRYSKKEVSTTGAMSGLSLILNVEEYEHVPGYVSGVGVKIHLHDADEIPSMQALGLAAEPGAHSLGILSYTKTENLQPPFGRCGEVPLNLSMSDYTEAKCRLEKNTLELNEQCGCKEPYMPGNLKVCNLKSYLQCSKGANYSNNIPFTECPSACTINSFSVQLSQSKLSGLRISEVLGNKSDQVQAKYLKALEMSHRIDAKEFGSVVLSLETTGKNLLKLRDYIYFSIIQFETSTVKHIEVAIQTLVKLVIDDIKTGGLEMLSKSDQVYYQDFQPKLSYLLASMRSVYDMLAFYKDVQFEAISNTHKTEAKVKWYKQVANDTYLKLVFLNETSTIFSRERSGQTKSSTACQPLSGGEKFALTLGKVDCNCLYGLLEERIQKILGEFESVIEILREDDDPFSSWSKQVQVGTINDMLELLRETSRCKSRYEQVSNEVENWLKSESIFPEMKNYTTELVSQNMLITFNEIQAWISDLKNNYLSSGLTLEDLAKNVTEESLESQMRKINTIVNDITQRVVVPILETMTNTEQSIAKLYQDYLQNLVRLDNSSEFTNFQEYARTMKIWRKPTVNLEMPEARNFLLSENETWQVWPLQESLSSFCGTRSMSRLNVIASNYFYYLREQINAFTLEMGERYETVKKNTDVLNALLSSYLKATAIDDDFIMSNFLMLDIYYGEMKFDTVSTSPNYEWINFFSDLGSYFGLLMGCSVLTMFEVVDLIVYHSIVKAVEFFDERKQKRRHVINVNIPALPPPTAPPPDNHRSIVGILNRAFSPERKSGHSNSSDSTSIRMGSDDSHRTDSSLPSYHTVNLQANVSPWNIQL